MDPLHALFAEAQRTVAAHARASASAAKLIQKAGPSLAALSASLSDCVDRVLVVGKAEPAVDRVLAFTCKVATAEECALLHPLLEVRAARTCSC